MNNKSLIGNLCTAFAAQGVSFLCSVIMSLLVPKILGVAEYGYWQLFVFYTSYVSFFQLGLNDGVYLQHGGETRLTINKSLIKSEYIVGIIFQLIISFSIVLIALFSNVGSNRAAVIIGSGFYLVISNSTYYFGYVLQSMNETKKFSYGSMLERVVFLIPLLICIALRITDFRFYVFFSLVSRSVSLCYTFWNVREFFIVDSIPAQRAIAETVKSMRLGIILTVANICGMLIVGLARFVIDALWGIEAFGEVSLSLSLVNFALTFISQASMVLFPALRQSDKSHMAVYHARLRDGLNVILPFALVLYYPLRIMVGYWLPQYGSSLDNLVYLMPICVYGAMVDLEVATFFKVRCEPKKLLITNLSAVVLASLLIVIAAFFIHDPQWIIMAAVTGVAMRYFIGERWLSQLYGNAGNRVLTSCAAVTCLFVVANAAFSIEAGFCLVMIGESIHAYISRDELQSYINNIYVKIIKNNR